MAPLLAELTSDRLASLAGLALLTPFLLVAENRLRHRFGWTSADETRHAPALASYDPLWIAGLWLFGEGALVPMMRRSLESGGELPLPLAGLSMLASSLYRLVLLVVLLLILRWRRGGIAGVALGKWPTRAELARGILLVAAFVPLVFAVNIGARVQLEREPHPIEKMLKDSTDPMLWGVALLSAVVAAPLLEELLFRGVLQRTLRAELVSAGLAPSTGGLVAIVISSAAFGAVHPSWPDPIPLFLLSIGFGLALERTGHLAAPMAAHALFNLTNLALMKFAT